MFQGISGILTARGSFNGSLGRISVDGQTETPNFMVNIYPGPGNASTNLIVPIDEHHTLAVYEFFFVEGMAEAEAGKIVDLIDQVQREDVIICESVQRGLRSGYYQQGQLMLSRENGIQHFQKLLHRFVTAEP